MGIEQGDGERVQAHRVIDFSVTKEIRPEDLAVGTEFVGITNATITDFLQRLTDQQRYKSPPIEPVSDEHQSQYTQLNDQYPQEVLKKKPIKDSKGRPFIGKFEDYRVVIMPPDDSDISSKVRVPIKVDAALRFMVELGMHVSGKRRERSVTGISTIFSGHSTIVYNRRLLYGMGIVTKRLEEGVAKKTRETLGVSDLNVN